MFPIWDNMPGRLTRKTSEFLIHAPHSKAMIGRHHQLISTHAPRMGSDWSTAGQTHQCRRNFNPRSPYGERPGLFDQVRRQGLISTHAPRMGSDLSIILTVTLPGPFQPTLPVWGATGSCGSQAPAHEISTHAPRMGSDS